MADNINYIAESITFFKINNFLPLAMKYCKNKFCLFLYVHISTDALL